jgi:hypothetical protein
MIINGSHVPEIRHALVVVGETGMNMFPCGQLEIGFANPKFDSRVAIHFGDHLHGSAIYTDATHFEVGY